MSHRSTAAFLALALVPAVGAAQAQPARAGAAAQPAASQVIVAHASTMTWMAAPPALPAGAQLVLLDGNPAEAVPLTFRLKFPPNYRIPPHFHSVIEHVTVLEEIGRASCRERV